MSGQIVEQWQSFMQLKTVFYNMKCMINIVFINNEEYLLN